MGLLDEFKRRAMKSEEPPAPDRLSIPPSPTPTHGSDETRRRVALTNLGLDGYRAKQRGRWWCQSCASEWRDRNRAPLNYWTKESGPHVCPNCDRYAFTMPAPPPAGLAEEFEWVRPDQEVSGESHYKATLEKILGPSKNGHSRRRAVVAVLTHEPDNEYDSNAVRVEIGGEMVGYIPRDNAGAISKRLAGEPLALPGLVGAAAEAGSNLSVRVELPW